MWSRGLVWWSPSCNFSYIAHNIWSLTLNQYVGKLKYNICPGSNGNCYKWKRVDSTADGLLNWMKFDIHTKMWRFFKGILFFQRKLDLGAGRHSHADLEITLHETLIWEWFQNAEKYIRETLDTTITILISHLTWTLDNSLWESDGNERPLWCSQE